MPLNTPSNIFRFFPFFFFFLCSSFLLAQIKYYEDSFYGGVTAGGYSPEAGDGGTGNFNINVPAGSTIRKAFFMIGRHGTPPYPWIIVSLNGSNYWLDTSSQVTPTFDSYYGGNSGVHAFDITDSINPAIQNYTLTVPWQAGNDDRYQDFYLFVAYENPNLDYVSTAIFLNTFDFIDTLPQNYNIGPLSVPLDTFGDIGISLFTGYICDTVTDGEYVFINNNYIGLIGGNDYNSGYCGGPIGNFYYLNRTLFGLGDDSANFTVSGSDALAKIQPLISQNSTSFSMNFSSQISNPSNSIWGCVLVYSKPACANQMQTAISKTDANCYGGSDGMTAVAVSGGNFSYTYKWSSVPVQTNDTAFNLSAGKYFITTTDSASCYKIDSVTIAEPALIITSQNLNICDDDSIFIGGGWQKIPGTYNDTLTAINGCDSVIKSTLSILPDINANQNLFICYGDSIFIGGDWQKVNGIYYDTLSTINGCDSIVTSSLFLWSGSLINKTLSICEGDSIFIGGNWQTVAGIFYDTLIAANSCDSVIKTTLNILPVSVTNQNISICENESIFIGGGWQSTSGNYFDTLIAANGCDSIITTILKTDTLPAAKISSDVSTICMGESILLNASGGKSYLWSTGEKESTITVFPSDITTYTVIVTDDNNCSDSETLTVTVDGNCIIYVPTMFSPNNDGNNDILFVRGIGIKSLSFAIYDRWGEKVFETEDLNYGWDGAFRGKPLNPGVFVYFANVIFTDGKIEEKKGNVTLVGSVTD